MAVSDKHLISLKLILKQFGIDIGPNFDYKSQSNDDLICSCIALIQSLYPLNYKFEIMKVGGRHRVRSVALWNEINVLRKENNSIQFLLTEKQYALRSVLLQKIKKVAAILKVPQNIKVSQLGWIYMLGFCIVAQRELSETKFLRIMTNEYREFLPYLDIAHEKIKELKIEK